MKKTLLSIAALLCVTLSYAFSLKDVDLSPAQNAALDEMKAGAVAKATELSGEAAVALKAFLDNQKDAFSVLKPEQKQQLSTMVTDAYKHWESLTPTQKKAIQDSVMATISKFDNLTPEQKTNLQTWYADAQTQWESLSPEVRQAIIAQAGSML